MEKLKNICLNIIAAIAFGGIVYLSTKHPLGQSVLNYVEVGALGLITIFFVRTIIKKKADSKTEGVTQEKPAVISQDKSGILARFKEKWAMHVAIIKKVMELERVERNNQPPSHRIFEYDIPLENQVTDDDNTEYQKSRGWLIGNYDRMRNDLVPHIKDMRSELKQALDAERGYEQDSFEALFLPASLQQLFSQKEPNQIGQIIQICNDAINRYSASLKSKNWNRNR